MAGCQFLALQVAAVFQVAGPAGKGYGPAGWGYIARATGCGSEMEQSKDATQPAEKQGNSLSDVTAHTWNWIDKNVVNPAINVAAITPYNALANVVNSGSQKLFNTDFLSKKNDLEVQAAPFGSTEWMVQNITGGLAMTIPYGIAGKGAGGALRTFGEKTAMTGLGATILRSEITASALGAAGYGAIQSTKPGETWYGNAISQGVGFGVFGAGNHFTGELSVGARLAGRVGTGALGAATQTALSDGISQGRLITGDELMKSAVTGAAMNLALPVVQRGFSAGVDAINIKMDRGMPIDRYVNSNNSVSEAVDRSSLLNDLVKQYPWARVQPKGATNSANGADNLVRIDNATGNETPEAKRFAHELDHLTTQAHLASDPLIVQSKQLLNSDPEASWQHFREARLNNELSALGTEHAVGAQLGLQQSAFDANALRQTIPSKEATPGMTYEQMWRSEYSAFAKSGGTELPHLDYRSDIASRTAIASERQAGVALLTEPAFDSFMEGHPELMQSLSGQEKTLRSFKPKLQGANKETPLVKDELRKMFGDNFVSKGDRAEDVAAKINDRLAQLNTYKSTVSGLGTRDPLTPRDILNVEERSKDLGFAIPETTRSAVNLVKDATVNLSPASQALVGKYRIAGESGAPFDLRTQIIRSDQPHHVIADVLNTPALSRMVADSGVSRQELRFLQDSYESALTRRADMRTGDNFVPPSWKGKVVSDQVINLKLTPDGQLAESVYRQAEQPLREMFGGKVIPRDVDRFFKQRPAGVVDETYALRIVQNQNGDAMLLRLDPSYNQGMAKGYMLFVDRLGKPLENVIHVNWGLDAANPSAGIGHEGVREIKRDLPGDVPKERVYTTSRGGSEQWNADLNLQRMGFNTREEFLTFLRDSIQQQYRYTPATRVRV